MVDYPNWTRAVHEAYKENGGVYEGRGTTQELTKLASEWWNENRSVLRQRSYRDAVSAAETLLEREL